MNELYEITAGKQEPRGGWPRKRVRTPNFPMPSHLSGNEEEEIGIDFKGTKGSQRARAAQGTALGISAVARNTKMYITAGDQGYMDIHFTAGPEEYWDKINHQREQEVLEQREGLRILYQRIREHPKIAKVGLDYLAECVRQRLLDGARWGMHEMKRNYVAHCKRTVGLINEVYKSPENPRDPDRLGRGRAKVGLNNTEHLQRMAAEWEVKEESRLQKHRMELDMTSHSNGRRRLDAMNRAKEAEARMQAARERREACIDRRAVAQSRITFPGAYQHREPAMSQARRKKIAKHGMPKESLFQHLKKWHDLWQAQRAMRLVRRWHHAWAEEMNRIKIERFAVERGGSAGLFENPMSRLRSIGAWNQDDTKTKPLGKVVNELQQTTVASRPIMFDLHAKQQAENLREIQRHFRTHGMEAHEVPIGMRIRDERQTAKNQLVPMLKSEAEQRERTAFLRFSYHKLCRRMVESFRTKSGPVYTTITNFLTMADLNFRDRLQACLRRFRSNFVFWRYEDSIRRERQEALLKNKKLMQRAKNANVLREERTVKPKWRDGAAKYTFVKNGDGNFKNYEAPESFVARDEDGWPIEAIHGHYGRERSGGHAAMDFSGGLTFPPVHLARSRSDFR